jgi:hypothetical protein
MVVECMCCHSRLGLKSSEGGRSTVTGGICERCLDLHYPLYAGRVRMLRMQQAA